MTATPTLHAALVKALADLVTIEKGKTAQIPTKSGGSYSYSYADLADVVELTRPALAKHGLVALTPVHAHADGLACTVEIVHESGESKVFPPLSFRAGGDPQATGSAITYHRRYALLAALGIAADDDDDGATATEQARSSARQPSSSRNSSSGGAGPTEKQLAYAKDLAAELGDAAVTVVPSIVEEVVGRRVKLAEVPRGDMGRVIDELKRTVEQAQAADDEKVADLVASGEEPFL